MPSHFLFYFDPLLTFQRTGGWELFAELSLQAVLSSVPQLPEGASCPGFISFCRSLASALGLLLAELQLQGTPGEGGQSHWALPGEADKVWKLPMSVSMSLPARVCSPLPEEWLLPTRKGKVLLCLKLEGFQGA